ncbi:MAG TPA: amidohydrolase family protein [Methanocorpusculum sp.]|nr:amidohydrolase family protein [Methanocorpusculum sp.]
MRIFDNALLYNPVSCTWIPSSFSVEKGKIKAVGKPGSLSGHLVFDLEGARVIPGLIDSHVHIESSLLTPAEFGRLVLQHGVTTVIADPHEIANVAGTAGIDFMISDAENSPADVGGAVVSYEDLKRYVNHEKVLGLGEMMNVPGVLFKDAEVSAKLSLFKRIDGHAPGLSGESLCDYVSCGILSDHECTTAEEAEEKLLLGQFIFLRDGDAAKNVAALTPVVNFATASRCCFATDDRHVDSIAEDGSIDNCIRAAVSAGMPLELALRLATLSAADYYNLSDRGIIAPGRCADFCILEEGETFKVSRVYKNGIAVSKKGDVKAQEITFPKFVCTIPTEEEMKLPSGMLKVIETIPGEIITECGKGRAGDDGIQKIVCVDRYRGEGFGVGLIKGLNIKQGAIATSVSHDAHNIIAAGASDSEIISAVKAVSEAGGGMAVVLGDETTVLSLPAGGLMTFKPYEEVLEEMSVLNEALEKTGADKKAFMSLSFMALTVVPHLKITPRGLFDGDSFSDTDIKC